MALRIFLGLEALVWLPYGLYCLTSPGSLADAAGVAATSPTGSAELRAMYGGLQVALGLLAGLALARPGLVRPALVALLFAATGLALGRALGVALDGAPSAYTALALGFEAVTAAAAAALLARTARPA